ncbi:MAG: desulfoferrodoxin family protein [Cellulosilyticaceae bacterium]
MYSEKNFFYCKHCGNLVGMIHKGGGELICCGEKMVHLTPNTVEASAEKHLPVVAIEPNAVRVNIGSVPHPMIPEHHINWIYVLTTSGGMRKALDVDGEPTATFALCETDKVIAVYAYCNLHGLWKVSL